MLSKVCPKCVESKPFDCFGKNNKAKDKLQTYCKQCRSEYAAENKETISKQRKKHYTTNREAILEKQKTYYMNNRETLLEYQNKYLSEHREQRSEYLKQYYQDNKESVSETQHEYYQNNKNRIKTRVRVYQKENIEDYLANSAKRRALFINATPSWSDGEAVKGMYRLASVFNRIGLDLHVDHIVPLNSSKVCGLHCESNLQLLSSSDNISKGNRWWPDMWS